MDKPSPRSMSALEQRVMQTIWSLGPSTVEEIRQALATRNPLADSTVRTLLRRLEDKGFVTHTVEGRANIYEPLLVSRKAAVHAVRQIIDWFCGGSVEDLLVGMVDDEVLDHDELLELADKIVKARQKEGESHV